MQVPTSNQEQFGVQYLAQGHFDMQLVEPETQVSDHTIAGPLALALELQPPHCLQ